MSTAAATPGTLPAVQETEVPTPVTVGEANGGGALVPPPGAEMAEARERRPSSAADLRPARGAPSGSCRPSLWCWPLLLDGGPAYARSVRAWLKAIARAPSFMGAGYGPD